MKRRATDRFRYRWGPVLAYMGLAATLALGLFLQRQELDALREQKQADGRAACEILEHRIGTRTADRLVLGAIRAVTFAVGLNDVGRQIVVPDRPTPRLRAERDRVCEAFGIPTERHFDGRGKT